MTVNALLAHLDVVPESVLVIRGDTLVTHDARLADDTLTITTTDVNCHSCTVNIIHAEHL